MFFLQVDKSKMKAKEKREFKRSVYKNFLETSC